MERRLFIAVLLLAALTPAAADAQFYEGARPAALGDAYSSVASGNEALYFNPAGLSLYLNRYNLDMGYAYNPTGGTNQLNASIVDSTTTSPLSVGVAFTYFFGGMTVPEPRQTRYGYRIDLGVAYPLGTQKALWGGELKYVNMNINSTKVNINTCTLDTGFLFVPTRFTKIAVVGRNLIPAGSRLLPYQSVIGFSAGKEPAFWLSAEVTGNFYGMGWSNIAFQYSAGAEVFLGKVVALRGGYMYDGTNDGQQYVSAGLGIVTEKFGMSLSYKQNVITTADRFLLVALNIYLGTQ